MIMLRQVHRRNKSVIRSRTTKRFSEPRAESDSENFIIFSKIKEQLFVSFLKSILNYLSDLTTPFLH